MWNLISESFCFLNCFSFRIFFHMKKLFCAFCANFARKIGKKWGKVKCLIRSKRWWKYIVEIKTCHPLFICPINLIELSSKFIFCIGNVFLVFPKKSVSSGHKPALVPDKWIFFCKVSIRYTSNDSGYPISVRYCKLVYMKVTNWC